MPISDDLFLAILSMDAYNRGYRVGITINGNQLGTATLGADSSILGTGVAEGVDFFSQTYSWNGKTVISYRGTDSNAGNSGLVYDGDANNGYGLRSAITTRRSLASLHSSIKRSAVPGSADAKPQ